MNLYINNIKLDISAYDDWLISWFKENKYENEKISIILNKLKDENPDQFLWLTVVLLNPFQRVNIAGYIAKQVFPIFESLIKYRYIDKLELYKNAVVEIDLFINFYPNYDVNSFFDIYDVTQNDLEKLDLLCSQIPDLALSTATATAETIFASLKVLKAFLDNIESLKNNSSSLFELFETLIRNLEWCNGLELCEEGSSLDTETKNHIKDVATNVENKIFNIFADEQLRIVY